MEFCIYLTFVGLVSYLHSPFFRTKLETYMLGFSVFLLLSAHGPNSLFISLTVTAFINFGIEAHLVNTTSL